MCLDRTGKLYVSGLFNTANMPQPGSRPPYCLAAAPPPRRHSTLLEPGGAAPTSQSGNATLTDAACLWVEAELVASEIERSPLAAKEEATAAQDLRDGVSSFIAQMRDDDMSPDPGPACTSLRVLKSAIEQRTLGEDVSS
jgi:hypothetical protein